MDWMTQEIARNWKEYETTVGSEWLVAVDWQRLEEVMEEHTPGIVAAKKPSLPPVPGAGSKDPAVALSYILAGNALNFHYKTPGQAPYQVSNPDNPERPHEGFMAFWHKLYRHFGENIITADMIRPHAESVETIREFFRDRSEIPLPELRQRCWSDYSRRLREQYGGSPLGVLDAIAPHGPLRAFHGGVGLVEMLVKRFPEAYGQDHRTIYGRTYRFYKRARLVAVLLHNYAVENPGQDTIPPIEDIADIGLPVDYQLPRWFASPAVRVLRYSPELEQAIEQGKELERGSADEILPRAGTAAACAHWMEARNVPGNLLDPYIFSLSRGLPNKAIYSKHSDY